MMDSEHVPDTAILLQEGSDYAFKLFMQNNKDTFEKHHVSKLM